MRGARRRRPLYDGPAWVFASLYGGRTLGLGTLRTRGPGTWSARRRRPLHGGRTPGLGTCCTFGLGTRSARRRHPLHTGPASGTYDTLPLARAHTSPRTRTRPRHSSEPGGRSRAPGRGLLRPSRDRQPQDR
ncbi:hypothetical protein [Streptomyces sp. NPDC048637]|uniref:hypothetical protein n=1 Tax=Streptomyces sp. NPDC048637 TaxID=3155636 RepID=UPI0034369572